MMTDVGPRKVSPYGYLIEIHTDEGRRYVQRTEQGVIVITDVLGAATVFASREAAQQVIATWAPQILKAVRIAGIY